jgi:aerobic-type carbon monoxide dehydrogenase small subunit (CoxS/CutS family)
MDTSFTLTVNGQRHTLTTDPERPLLEVLREDLKLTGPKRGCGEGECGACTVLIEGQRQHSCLLPIKDAAGKTITTIEGLSTGDKLHPVQEAFAEEGAMQCGFCTSGMILAATALLKEKPKPTDAEILSWMNPHICRCNGYVRILQAVRRAAGQVRK